MSRELAVGLTQYFQTLLVNEGHAKGNVEWDESAKTSDLIFQVDGRGYLLIADADDVNFVRLVFPNFWPLDGDDAFATALQVISLVNGRCKGAKVHINGANNNIVATAEFLISAKNPQLDSALFVRYLRMLNTASDEVVRIMREVESPSA